MSVGEMSDPCQLLKISLGVIYWGLLLKFPMNSLKQEGFLWVLHWGLYLNFPMKSLKQEGFFGVLDRGLHLQLVSNEISIVGRISRGTSLGISSQVPNEISEA